jgi:hypothetical protein
VKLTHDGLSVWYGTPDAPAPGDEGIVARAGTSLVVGVHPANPTNSVVVRFRVDGGPVRTVPGRELRTDHDRQAQYFLVAFPPFPVGDLVEYAVILGCGGRQVPSALGASRLSSKFRLAPREPAARTVARSRASGRSSPIAQRFEPTLTFVATVALSFEPPQYIGETAAGMRINFFVREGTVKGEGVSGKVLEGTSDHLTVRRDGVGVIRILGNIVLDDGGGMDFESGGYVDLGPDGYRMAVAHRLPDRSPIVLSPLISTRHPKYRWLSRVQCVGVGQTHLDAGQASYNIYAVAPRALS